MTDDLELFTEQELDEIFNDTDTMHMPTLFTMEEQENVIDDEKSSSNLFACTTTATMNTDVKIVLH